MLLWLKGGIMPNEARNKILDPNSDFQKALVEYLEAAHWGDFMTGSYTDVQESVSKAESLAEYIDPTKTMPVPPPEPCVSRCTACLKCQLLSGWWEHFKFTVDDLVFRSNIHMCYRIYNKDGSKKVNKEHVGCLDNIWKRCKARFARQVFKQTEVDPATGSLNMWKLEVWINTFSAPFTYLFRCNMDITSL
ncbi:hypothetical protein DXG01_003150 [Tephrocybe rancida]|nr:hypothetical protein DXG01_003150 [Tephrocybe rancida]